VYPQTLWLRTGIQIPVAAFGSGREIVEHVLNGIAVLDIPLIVLFSKPITLLHNFLLQKRQEVLQSLHQFLPVQYQVNSRTYLIQLEPLSVDKHHSKQFVLKPYIHPLAPRADPHLCLKSMLFSPSSDNLKLVRDGRVEDFAFVQGEDVDGEVVEEGIGDEKVDRIAFLLGCDQLGRRLVGLSKWSEQRRKEEDVLNEYNPSLPLARSACARTGKVVRLSQPRVYRRAGRFPSGR
jgi:hypothetical protein